MSQVIIFYKGGIMVADGPAAAGKALAELGQREVSAIGLLETGLNAEDFISAVTSDGVQQFLGEAGAVGFGGAVGASTFFLSGNPWVAVLAGESAEMVYKQALKEANEVGRWWGNYLYDQFHPDEPTTPPTRRDPLVFDLNGDGLISTTSAASNGIHFDYDANGFAESTGWLNPADAFLAVDKNGNGTIDNGNELFGDQTVLRSGAKAASGLQALAEWDSNRDGIIDASDTRFHYLRVWTDSNQDGISQADELHTLLETGIASVYLTGANTNAAPDPNGNTLTRTSTFTRTDGTPGLAGEIAFTRDTAPASRGGAIDARRIGFMESAFGQALGNPDSNAAVQWRMSWQQVREYYGASLLAQTTLKPLFDQIQYTWDDTRQTLKADLSGVESLLQDSLAADTATGTAQLADFARAIKGLGAEDSVNYLALRETFLEQDAQNGTELTWAMDSAGMKVYDHRGMGSRGLTPHVEGTDGSDAVRGHLYEGDGYLNSLYGNDTIWGTGRSETLINEDGASLLYGGDGADRLWAGDGDDTLDGGTGNDTLQGDAGNDTYVFRKDSGIDRVKGWNTGDRVWLAANADQVTLKRSRNDLVIGFTDATDKLVIENYTLATPGSGTVITYRDGSTSTHADMDAWLADPARVGAGMDILISSPNDDSLDGHGGDDQIAGNEGNDVIEGGSGNDTVYGAAHYDAYADRVTAVSRANGDDRYVFRRGDGQDTIIDLDSTPNTDTLTLIGITPDDVTVSVANHRSSWIGGTWTSVADIAIDLGLGDRVTLTQVLSSGGLAPGKIERIEFDPASTGSGQASTGSGQAASTGSGQASTGSGQAGTVWSDAELRGRLFAGGAGNERGTRRHCRRPAGIRNGLGGVGCSHGRLCRSHVSLLGGRRDKARWVFAGCSNAQWEIAA